jgi:ribosomal protein S18 acetylase RimI-like enzyme
MAMSVQLTNLLARRPSIEDLYAITELITVCDIAEHGVGGVVGDTGSTIEDLQSHWQNFCFNLTTDAWVIVTKKGQFAGFGCVWHRDHEEFYNFVCVHPQYRKRGIGTLLLRLVEERARQQMCSALPDVRVNLKAQVSSSNAEARSLFEREGYILIREFWRVTLELDETLDGARSSGKFKVDMDVDAQRLVGLTPLYEREGVFSVRQYCTYEKELRAAQEQCECPDEDPDTLISAG